jgi:3-hydroxymyristoyl/3-hydroxydecanoyl-(acyl carrier protein) dehydratase
MADFDVIAGSDGEPAIDVVVGETSRFFTGHFPGRAILPAVAQLVLVEELARRSLDPRARLRTIEHLRLLRPVYPGARLSVRLHVPRAGAPVRFEIDQGTTRASEGAFRWATDPQP